jgi:hypothetical protein
MYAVAGGLFFIGMCLFLICKAVLDKVDEIWGELGPLLEHEMLMRRIEARLMIEDSGFTIPDWLNDDDEDDDAENVVRLVPKEDSTE